MAFEFDLNGVIMDQRRSSLSLNVTGQRSTSHDEQSFSAMDERYEVKRADRG